MAHAEICPVCGGSGSGDDGCEPRIIIDCHGCGGKGWVEVGSDDPVLPVPWPVHPSRPIINISPWVYESGIYSANIEVLI